MVHKCSVLAEIVVYSEDLAQVFLMYGIGIKVLEEIGIEPLGQIGDSNGINGIYQDIRVQCIDPSGLNCRYIAKSSSIQDLVSLFSHGCRIVYLPPNPVGILRSHEIKNEVRIALDHLFRICGKCSL
ncbi:MAG: hypothetical protein A4E48_00109 [Methanosaeta sp. PtaU1.Bin060]|nr:MAG: hypothetical protein A4E48_00109 [Methanosaeta sp. PtaU1.Bin060]